MIDDRICIYYVADRVQEIRDGKAKADEFLRELNHNIGVNARIKRNDPDALVADLPPIDPPRKKGRKKK
jgi:hypothetical protein